MNIIAKKGEWVRIVDFGYANSFNVFTLNKPYKLSQDLIEDDLDFRVELDDENKPNGWNNALDLCMKFEKCNEPFIYPQTTIIRHHSPQLYTTNDVLQILQDYDRELKLDTFAYTKAASFTVKEWFTKNIK